MTLAEYIHSIINDTDQTHHNVLVQTIAKYSLATIYHDSNENYDIVNNVMKALQFERDARGAIMYMIGAIDIDGKRLV